MRIVTPLRVLSAAAAIALFAGCSGRTSLAVSPIAELSLYVRTGTHIIGHYACPAMGSIVYVSDATNSIINAYTGEFAGQAPCGQIFSRSLGRPIGLYVQSASHDLYVANEFGHDILVFQRGQTTAYNSYVDPTGQFPVDVTVAGDGTVIAVDSDCNILTWIGGPSGGRFVGSFPITNCALGSFVSVNNSGTVYFDDFVGSKLHGALGKLSCPAGACGPQTQIKGVSLHSPQGLAFDALGDLLLTDAHAGSADTFELPNPKPSAFPLAGKPQGMAINARNNCWFIADGNRGAAEYLYPSGVLVGTVPVNPSNGDAAGIAIDP